MMRNLPPSLNSKQLRWIDEYLIDFNGAAAAVRAGYSAKCARSIACELLTKPDIQAVLQAKQGALAEELRITRQGVVQGLLEAVDMGRVQQNPGAMVGALREVAKMLGFYAPEVKRVQLTAPQNSAYQKLSLWTDAQLLDAISVDSAVTRTQP